MALSKKILVIRLSRVFILLVSFIALLIFLQKTNQIETVFLNSETIADTTLCKINGNELDIRGREVDDYLSYFHPYDLSKTIYNIDLTKKPCMIHPVWISFSNEIVSPSPMSRDYITASFGGDLLFVDSFPIKDIIFYVKDVAGENIQFIRNFFLTELLCILLGLLLAELYCVIKLWQRVHYSPILSIKRKENSLMMALSYLFLSLVALTIIWRFNVVKTVEVKTDNYKMELSEELFSLYDISCRAFEYNLTKADIHSKTITWSANEIIEFPSMTPTPISSSMNEIVFVPDKDGGFHHSFLTENLESSNYQDIRLFIITTLLALFFARFVYYSKEYVKKKYLYKK